MVPKPKPDPLAGIPLHNLEMEQALLGALLLRNTSFDVVAGKLEPTHFYEPLHQVLYAEIARKIGLGEPATPLTVRGVVPPDMDIAGLTGNQYLARLAAHGTIALSVPAFADTIIQFKAAREHVLNARDLVDQYLSGVPVDEALKAFNDISEATRNGFMGFGLRDTSATIQETMDATIERMQSALTGDVTALGIPTCIRELDRCLGGFQRGNLVVIAARPSMGKSSTMVSIGRQVAAQGYGVGIQSLEMDKITLGMRFITDQAYDPRDPISYNAIMKAQGITLERQQILTDASRALHALPLEFDFATSMTVAEVAASARKMAARLAKKGIPLSVLMIDYLKFIKATNRYAGQLHYEIGEITAALKGLARQMDCCVVLFHQLNREVEKTTEKRPGMEHLRASGDVEQDADVIILLYRAGYYIIRSGDLDDPAKSADAKIKAEAVAFDLDMIVAKQRMGPAQDCKVFCDITTSSVRSREAVQRAYVLPDTGAPDLPPEF